jgi:hypothetical protein
MQWPNTFATEERRDVRKYVLAYATEHDLLGAAISDETQTKALAVMIQARHSIPCRIGEVYVSRQGSLVGNAIYLRQAQPQSIPSNGGTRRATRCSG